MDPMHIDWRVRLYVISANKCLQLGAFAINLVALHAIVKRNSLDLGLLTSDMNSKDKQNHAATMRLFDLEVSMPCLAALSLDDAICRAHLHGACMPRYPTAEICYALGLQYPQHPVLQVTVLIMLTLSPLQRNSPGSCAPHATLIILHSSSCQQYA